MRLDMVLRAAEKQLQKADVPTARLDTLVLLEDATGRERGWLLAHPEFELSIEVENGLVAKLNRRAQHVPLAYIRGRAEFYGREFAVNEHTLVPRPETETMLTVLKRTLPKQSPSPSVLLVDIGTGSGAIAVTAKLEFSSTAVVATDIDEACLQTARENARVLGADMQFLQGNLLEPLGTLPTDQPLILLCNLPYVPDGFAINTAATHEPRHAIFGGTDGLDLYCELFAQLDGLATKPTAILAESLPPQHTALADIAANAGYRLVETDDFIQLFEL